MEGQYEQVSLTHTCSPTPTLKLLRAYGKLFDGFDVLNYPHSNKINRNHWGSLFDQPIGSMSFTLTMRVNKLDILSPVKLEVYKGIADATRALHHARAMLLLGAVHSVKCTKI